MRVVLLLALVLVGCLGAPAPAVGSGIYGVAMLGPTCPVQRDPPDPGCDDRPFVGELVALRGADVAATFSTDAAGAFNVTLAPGEYTIRHAGDAMLPTCSAAGPIIVLAGTWTRADVACDTGIR